MSFRAVVKHRIDASPDERRTVLKRGIADCAMELVGELGLSHEDIERVLEDAQGDAELELEMKAQRDGDET
jgi:hypothetical protein